VVLIGWQVRELIQILELYGQEDSRNSDRLLDLSRGPAQFGLHNDLPAGDGFSASKGLAELVSRAL
jgi:hypothetical protein